MTTTGGGMLVAQRWDWRFWSQLAGDPGIAYHHTEMGYNCRVSNVLAGIGHGQLEVLDERVRQRRAVASRYRDACADLPALTFMPQAPFLVDEARGGLRRDDVFAALAREDIESCPLWKPMHLQPLYRDCACYRGEMAAGLFERGPCLRSLSSLEPADQERVIDIVRGLFRS